MQGTKASGDALGLVGPPGATTEPWRSTWLSQELSQEAEEHRGQERRSRSGPPGFQMPVLTLPSSGFTPPASRGHSERHTG